MNKIANEQVETFTNEAKRSMEENAERMSKGFEDVTQFGQDNVEAMVASGKAVAKAAEGINAEMMAYSKKAYEDAMAASQEMASARTVTEFFEKNTAFAKASFEGFVAQATRVNEMYSAAAKDAFAPVNARFTAAAEMVKTNRV
ncbi:MAG TPA: phasin family protein [Paracoccaceae bacterium]|nr:phasin family protein [Paracoccaceae bacterium]